MKSIYRKLDVNTGADAVHEGQAHGLIRRTARQRPETPLPNGLP